MKLNKVTTIDCDCGCDSKIIFEGRYITLIDQYNKVHKIIIPEGVEITVKIEHVYKGKTDNEN